MIPPRFEYEVATSVEHAVELLGAGDGGGGGARLLAGGQSLVPLLKQRAVRPALVVDLGRLDGLRYVREEGDRIAIGALTTYDELASSELLRERCPLLAHAASVLGDPQVRHCGTIGGSLAHADPAADLPAVLLALDGEVVVRGEAERTIPAAELFRGPHETSLAPAEVLCEVRVPALDSRVGWSYRRFRLQERGWPLLAVSALVRRDGERIADAALALANVALVPLRATAVERAVSETGSVAGAAAALEVDPPPDPRASVEYRRHVAQVLVERALEEAVTATA
jgi:carbon-monoxide dehydrogenase medium subunit